MGYGLVRGLLGLLFTGAAFAGVGYQQVKTFVEEGPYETEIRETEPNPFNYNATILLKMEELNGIRYFFSELQKLSWMDAMFYCQAFGLDLASIEDLAENNAIADHIELLGLSTESFYLSASKIGRSTYWLWLSSRPMVYENWASGEPGTAEARCIFLSGRQWYDSDCTNGRLFVCEEPQAQGTTPGPTSTTPVRPHLN